MKCWLGLLLVALGWIVCLGCTVPAVTLDGGSDARADVQDGLDSGPLADAPADGSDVGATFNVTAAASTGQTSMTVTYDTPPDPAEGVVLGNYTVPGLTLSGTPSLAGNVVTLTTSAQSAIAYTVTVTNVTRASDTQPLTVSKATFMGTTSFNVSSAASTANGQMTVTFDAPPNASQATNVNNYAVSGLVLSAPQLNGKVVTLTTSSQAAIGYTVTVSTVTRASDGEPLTTAAATFNGRTSFSVVSASSIQNTVATVTFDAPPNQAQATNANNYGIPGLTVSAAALNGNIATLTTSSQSAIAYTVTVSGVTRNADGEALTTKSAGFTGHSAFKVQGAASTDAVTITVTFDAAPNVGQATTLNNYAVPGLVLGGVPVLFGNTVTLTTSGQSAIAYTVTVSNVTRASDAEPLTTSTANFTGTAVKLPTVTNVVVTSTSPNNGAIAYNTGTATVKITGTDLGTVVCPAGVKLDDLDGVGAAVGTPSASCTVDDDTHITATFPAGIRTNAVTGWNVVVTNDAGSNATSSVRFRPVAGLLVSELYTGTTGFADHEYFEVYNPTATSIDTTGSGIGLRMHTRTSGGADTNKTLTAVTGGLIPSHGFLLIVSTASTISDGWYASRDYTYSAASAALVANGSVYISLSNTAAARVIDKAGWGTQPAGGFEGTALPNVSADASVERKPAGGAGHATDTDANATDFNVQSGTLTPRGTADAPQP